MMLPVLFRITCTSNNESVLGLEEGDIRVNSAGATNTRLEDGQYRETHLCKTHQRLGTPGRKKVWVSPGGRGKTRRRRG